MASSAPSAAYWGAARRLPEPLTPVRPDLDARRKRPARPQSAPDRHLPLHRGPALACNGGYFRLSIIFLAVSCCSLLIAEVLLPASRCFPLSSPVVCTFFASRTAALFFLAAAGASFLDDWAFIVWVSAAKTPPAKPGRFPRLSRGQRC